MQTGKHSGISSMTTNLPGVFCDQANVCDGARLLASIPLASAAIVVLDPQYRGVLDHLALGNEGARQGGRVSLPQMSDDDITRFVTLSAEALRPSGHLLLWLDKWHLVQGIDHWIAGSPLAKVDMITWDKQRIGMGYRSRCRSEFLVVLQKLPKRAKDVWTAHDIPDVWAEKLKRGGHPHAKPAGLMEALVRCLSRGGDLVVDPCAGGYGVMRAVAAVGGGRRFLGSDLRPLNDSFVSQAA